MCKVSAHKEILFSRFKDVMPKNDLEQIFMKYFHYHLLIISAQKDVIHFE